MFYHAQDYIWVNYNANHLLNESSSGEATYPCKISSPLSGFVHEMPQIVYNNVQNIGQ